MWVRIQYFPDDAFCTPKCIKEVLFMCLIIVLVPQPQIDCELIIRIVIFLDI